MSSPATTPFQGPRVVACHDDRAVLSLITQTLRTAGCRVIEAYDGVACYELALEIPAVRLLVVNSHLGELDGPALIERIRTELPHVAVLHVGSDPEGRVPLDVPTLAEPFSAEELLVAVKGLLPPGGTDQPH